MVNCVCMRVYECMYVYMYTRMCMCMCVWLCMWRSWSMNMFNILNSNYYYKYNICNCG